MASRPSRWPRATGCPSRPRPRRRPDRAGRSGSRARGRSPAPSRAARGPAPGAGGGAESPAADARDTAAQDVELLARQGLGSVGEEGEVDIGHRANRTRSALRRRLAGPRAGGAAAATLRRRAPARRDPDRRPWPFGRSPTRLIGERHVATAAPAARRAAPGPGTRRSRTRVVSATCSGVPSAMILAAAVAAFGAQVDDPVRRLDHVEVVLDHEDRVAGVDQPVEHLEQLLDVGEVETGRRLVEDVERPAGRAPRQLGGQLDPLRLAAGERGRRLAELDVAQADVVQRLELRRDAARPRRSRAPPRPSSPGRRRSTCPCSGSRAPRGCSACPCRPRTGRRRPGRNCISILMIPSPLQVSQRPPLTLKLKRPGV